MTTHRKRALLSGGAHLMVGEAVVQIAGLLRNLIVARMIAPDQFGVAAALAMSVALVEMLSDFGAGRFLTRLSEDAAEDWLGAAHGLSIVRGALGAAALFLLAPLIARLMQMPEFAWAFQTISVIPLVRAFIHHQVWLDQRNLRFRAFVACQAIPQIVTLGAAFTVATYLGDFRALMWLLIGNAALGTVMTHLVATTPYTVSFHRSHVREMMGFGLPLFADGCLMFMVQNGERIIVASVFGTTALGTYSAAYLMIASPVGIAGRIGLSLGVPQFASLRDDRPQRDRHYKLACAVGAAGAIALAVLLIMSGAELLRTLFGPNYTLSRISMAWLAFGFSLRLLRTAPTVLAIAAGDTLSALLANSARALALGGSLAAAWLGLGLWAVFCIGAIGELIATLVIGGLNRRRDRTPVGALLWQTGAVCLAAGGAWGLGEIMAGMGLSDLQKIMLALPAAAACAVGSLCLSRSVRVHLVQMANGAVRTVTWKDLLQKR